MERSSGTQEDVTRENCGTIGKDAIRRTCDTEESSCSVNGIPTKCATRVMQCQR